MLIDIRKLILLALLLSTGWTFPGVFASPLIPSSDKDIRVLERNGLPLKDQQEALDSHLGQAGKEGSEDVETAFYVDCLIFDGAEGIREQADLQQLAAPYVKRQVTLKELHVLAERIHQYYAAQGLFVAKAVVPVQTIEQGRVVMKIFYGRIGKIIVENKSRLLTERLESYAHVIQDGEIIRKRKVNDVVNNMDNLYGIKARGILTPGAQPGTADLLIKTGDRQAASMVVFADNTGNKLTGWYRLGINTEWDNVSRVGDMLTAGIFTTNKQAHNFNLAYELPVGNRGTYVGINVSRGQYGYEINQLLNASGTSTTYGIYGRTPLINDGWRLVNVAYGFDHRDIEDEYLLGPISLYSNKSSDAGYIGLTGHYNTPRYYTGYNLFYRTGAVHYQANGLGKDDFFRFNLDLAHVQHLQPRWDLRINLHGQTSSQSLDTSERISLGGINGVRAYPQGEATGDTGIQYTAELVYKTKRPGLAVSAYFDGGYVMKHQVDTSRTLLGYGMGISYARPREWYFRLDYARKINNDYNYSENTDVNGRIWFQMYKLF